MTYNNTEFSPIDDDTQESIEDIDEDIVDIIAVSYTHLTLPTILRV